ncbi:MAG: tetratricopeptide repeat protein, partial [Clostridiales bacterium]|nr:tetratricopeptide repeat protein [Clostridiales bacterium]
MDLHVQTKGNASPKGKPKVYLTCHPQDVRSLGRVIRDLFAANDCAVYYAEDMGSVWENMEVDLQGMNLFVIPVSYRLLISETRTMSVEFPFAKEHHIPVLPILLGSGLTDLYGQKFGTVQYLDPNATSDTGVSYEEKLKKYLNTVLISAEMVERIQAAFDTYIFLSYRKKDRKYADRLMRMIHSNPACRDIAIWYDEYLVPGEKFDESIERAMKKSDLFALLVTPNLINEDNYVRNVEYPAAKQLNKPILPAMAQMTDKKELARQYEEIPDCVDANDPAKVHRLILELISSAKLREKEDDPMHNFLIGLAYLDGIDVEVERSLALRLITSAATAGLYEAMRKLVSMYHDGTGTSMDLKKACDWQGKIVDYFTEKGGKTSVDTLAARITYVLYLYETGKRDEALTQMEEVYALCEKYLGEDNPETMTALNNLAHYYSGAGRYQEAIRMGEKSYQKRVAKYGAEDPQALLFLNNLAMNYGNVGNFQKEKELLANVLAVAQKTLGEDHPRTLLYASNYANSMHHLGETKKALAVAQGVLSRREKVYGERHPSVFDSEALIAGYESALGNYLGAIAFAQKAYEGRRQLLGEDHPNTLSILSELGSYQYKNGDLKGALESCRIAYERSVTTMGSMHYLTLNRKIDYCARLGDLGYYKTAADLSKDLYETFVKMNGKRDLIALRLCTDYSVNLYRLGKNQEAIHYGLEAYEGRRAVYGEEHPFTLLNVENLAYFYSAAGNERKALEYSERVLQIRRRV